MSQKRPTPIDEEIYFSENEIIVSKTDLKGRITYANNVFCRVAEMPTRDVIGQPHNIIRHPDMPRAVFKLLWDKVMAGDEIFAYVKNMSATGKYYWVIAHVTPSFDLKGKMLGFNSNRRRPTPAGISNILPLYKKLSEIENRHANSKEGLSNSFKYMEDMLIAEGKEYEEFIWSQGA
jgi:PAS domain S-box-containing protein